MIFVCFKKWLMLWRVGCWKPAIYKSRLKQKRRSRRRPSTEVERTINKHRMVVAITQRAVCVCVWKCGSKNRSETTTQQARRRREEFCFFVFCYFVFSKRTDFLSFLHHCCCCPHTTQTMPPCVQVGVRKPSHTLCAKLKRRKEDLPGLVGKQNGKSCSRVVPVGMSQLIFLSNSVWESEKKKGKATCFLPYSFFFFKKKKGTGCFCCILDDCQLDWITMITEFWKEASFDSIDGSCVLLFSNEAHSFFHLWLSVQKGAIIVKWKAWTKRAGIVYFLWFFKTANKNQTLIH